jgi:hypothetical protein
MLTIDFGDSNVINSATGTMVFLKDNIIGVLTAADNFFQKQKI